MTTPISPGQRREQALPPSPRGVLLEEMAASMPTSVRLPQRYVDVASDMSVRPRAVDPIAVRNAFGAWDRTGDGRINPADIVIFAQRNNLQPPLCGWESYVRDMFRECIIRTGFVRPSSVVIKELSAAQVETALAPPPPPPLSSERAVVVGVGV